MRPSILLALAVAVPFLACKSDSPSGGPFPVLGPPSASAELLSGVPPPRPPFKARMKDHVLLGITMRDAVARADLAEARREAQALVDLPVEAELEAGRREKLDAMTASARQMASAHDVQEAARTVASVARACGACHTAFGGPRLAVGDTPAAASGVAPAMARHQWAAARLWEGLAGPSDDAWTRGARALADAPLEPQSVTPGQTPVPALVKLATSVHELGRRAEKADAPMRAGEYAELLATCATCHAWLGGGPKK